jgi:hypothetical protein
MCCVPVQALILDEAHRLKSRTSATRAALLELPVHWWLLLSGTPVQNNMRELQVGRIYSKCTLNLLACHALPSMLLCAAQARRVQRGLS